MRSSGLPDSEAIAPNLRAPTSARGWHQIAIVIDDSVSSLIALEQTAEVARQRHARLTIIYLVSDSLPWAAMADICPRQLRRELLDDAARNLRRMVATVPLDVPCTTVVRCGNVTTELVKVLRQHPCDVVFLGLGRRGILGAIAHRAASWLARRAAGEVLALPRWRSADASAT